MPQSGYRINEYGDDNKEDDGDNDDNDEDIIDNDDDDYDALTSTKPMFYPFNVLCTVLIQVISRWLESDNDKYIKCS